MKINWYGLTTLQHFVEMIKIWFLTPFNKKFWEILFDDGDGTSVSYIIFGVLFMIIGFGFLWISTPILFPIVFLVSRIYCYKKSHKMVINALRSK